MIFLTEEHLTTEDFDYELPEELIAQTPLEHRDQSRMLVLDSKTGKYQDDYFYNVIDRLEPGDALVMNDSRVLPALDLWCQTRYWWTFRSATFK